MLDEEKLFYERFWNLHNDPVLLAVFKEFGIGVFRRSSVLEGLDGFLVQNNVKGRSCIEIGTCNGLTALVLARHFGHVTSFDIAPNNIKQRIVDFVGVKNIQFVDVRDNDHKMRVVGSMDFDGAYVDGDHIRDTELDFNLVSKCGQVVFHEYWEAQQPVWRLVTNLKSTGEKITTKGKLALWTR
jgi:hypothetical protein